MALEGIHDYTSREGNVQARRTWLVNARRRFPLRAASSARAVPSGSNRPSPHGADLGHAPIIRGRGSGTRLLLPERSIPQAFGLADGNVQFLPHLSQRDFGSKDFERPGLAPPIRIPGDLSQQLPACLEDHWEIDFVPQRKLTRAQRLQVFGALPPKLGKVIVIVEPQTASHSFECGSPGRQVEDLSARGLVGLPEGNQRLSRDQMCMSGAITFPAGAKANRKANQTRAWFRVSRALPNDDPRRLELGRGF